MPVRDHAEDWPRHRIDAAIERVLAQPFNIVDRVVARLGRTASVDEETIEVLRDRKARRRAST